MCAGMCVCVRVCVCMCVCVCACLCVQWKISVPEGERVRLTFTSFDLAPELCGDYVEVFDGHAAGAAKLGRQVQTEHHTQI